LITQLREMLESMTIDKQLEANANKSDKTNEVLKKIPNLIYIGVWVFGLILINTYG